MKWRKRESPALLLRSFCFADKVKCRCSHITVTFLVLFFLICHFISIVKLRFVNFYTTKRIWMNEYHSLIMSHASCKLHCRLLSRPTKVVESSITQPRCPHWPIPVNFGVWVYYRGGRGMVEIHLGSNLRWWTGPLVLDPNLKWLNRNNSAADFPIC